MNDLQIKKTAELNKRGQVEAALRNLDIAPSSSNLLDKNMENIDQDINFVFNILKHPNQYDNLQNRVHAFLKTYSTAFDDASAYIGEDEQQNILLQVTDSFRKLYESDPQCFI